MKKLTNNQQIEAINRVHGKDAFIFIEEFEGNQTDTKVQCKDHGIFITRANRLKNGSGCPICSKERVSKKKLLSFNEQIKAIELLHPNKFEFHEVFINNKTIVNVWCKTCKIYFKSSPDRLKQGNGCPECSFYLKGWNHTSWKNQGLVSTSFDCFKVYVIKAFNENEVFYKIGKTFRKIEERFTSNNFPYKYEIIKEFLFLKDQSKQCCDLEVQLQKMFKEYKYTPLLDFKGKGECFNPLDIQHIENIIENN